jgi:EAL domain-containing protein (putative c-di-GMP-specific phosphodiesterase class I)
MRLSVNLSPVQFAVPDLAERVQRVLVDTKLDPQRLTLEITESLFISDMDKTLGTLNKLKALGVHIAMDDFGTGYSSLSSLRSFPLDVIKIDRAFVSDVGRNSENSVIIQAVIIIAGALGMTTVAEGVETADQQTLLKALGCDKAQGYLYSRSLPADQVADFITSSAFAAVKATKAA